jgi:2-polyprenyl-3-methyl-5-hydroxy-6-metoxy-1,4-benzoquinol methylase
LVDQAHEGLLSPFLQRRRMHAVKKHLKGRVLDVGCGSGDLSNLVESNNYLGVDRDLHVLEIAKTQFPNHQFIDALPTQSGQFDTIACLAMIEHVTNPLETLQRFAELLAPRTESQIVLTTPHPAYEFIHTAGAKLGIFSAHGSDEHEDLLDKARLLELANQSGLKLAHYQRFLLGANQLALFQRA